MTTPFYPVFDSSQESFNAIKIQMTNIVETVFIHGNATSNQIFRFYTQLFVTVEGVIGTVLYCIIFAFLFIVRFEKGSGAFFVFLIVSSLHGFILSVLIVAFDCLHIIRNGDFVVVALGFGTNFFPPDGLDIAMQMFTIIAAYSWELVSTASVLQLISFTKSDMFNSYSSQDYLNFNLPNASLAHRLCLAYSWPASAFILNYFYGAPYFIPTPAYREVLSRNARDFYDIHDSERIYVNGFPFLPKTENGDISAIDLALKFALPTYFVSYTLFIVNTLQARFRNLQIRKNLSVNGIRLSKKTLRMQEQFFRTQLMQGVFPLTVLSVPFIIFITVLALGYELNKFSVIFSFSIWFTPTVQAIVMLSYIKATLDKQITGNTSVFIYGNATMIGKLRFFVQAVVTAEGVIATILFSILFALLYIVRFDKGSGAYRVFLTVSCAHGFMLSTMLIPLNFLHLIRNGDFVNIAFGFGTDFIAPENFRIPFLIFTNLVSYSWELVPTASVLQYIALTMPKMSLSYRLCLAYAWPVIAFVINYLYLPYFIPAPAYREVLARNSRDFYKIHDHERVYVYGFPFLPKPENGDISAIDVAIKFAAPTYSVSYGLFLFNVFRIRKNLTVYGVRLSSRTLKMQKQFFRTQLTQGLSPLIVLSVPFSIFFTVTILGYNLNHFSIIYSFALWFTPIVQALVMLSYIKATLNKQMNGGTVHNLTKTSVSQPQ
ncbi:hypothetical protein PRIPAC_90775 [Pristionchus pacificus]|uniref:G protein-coupled receptor n=1 Tax=Pristionchus pacificus TaxID=54126 RepID=A0A2A6B7E3_PRIPA|nr:hypothetical protein PRIPAC_90775 [Pristionchus pacificus]|eukprot:PDM61800.1 G protein-coupled receptor [Pristionchus pacificus]